MALEYRVPDEVTFRMDKYVQSMVKDFEEVINKQITTAKTPGADHTFMVRDDQESLSDEKSLIFHNATAKALYLCKRVHPDIQTMVSFLTTRIKAPDNDGWKKPV